MAFYRLCSSSAFNLFIQKDVVVLKSYAKNPFINTGVFNGLYFTVKQMKKDLQKDYIRSKVVVPIRMTPEEMSTLTTFWTKSLSTSHAARYSCCAQKPSQD